MIELWHGTNNKFIVIFNENKLCLNKKKIIDLCRNFKTDGLIKIRINKKIFMDFFNPDGTKDNCGNGLRVTASFCFNKKLCSNKGIIISLKQKFPFIIKKNKTTVIFKNVVNKKGLWNVGKVLHKTILTNNIEKAKEKARKIRNKLDCNVTIIKKLRKGIFAWTFERGVEDFTDACGTGAIAAALTTNENNVFMPGGLLEVRRNKENISLSGETKIIGVIK